MTQKIDLHSTIDASVWAAEFCKLNTAADEGAMLGWFANAIMAGFDEANRRASMPGACAVSPAESVQSIDTPELRKLLAAYRLADYTDTDPEIEAKRIFAHVDPKIAAAHAEGQRSAMEELAKEKERADRAERERDMLAKAIADAAQKAGIYNGEVAMTGPHLLMLVNDLAEVKTRNQYLERQPPDLSKLQRSFPSIGPGSNLAQMFAYEEGDYVRFADVQALLAQPLQQEGGKRWTIEEIAAACVKAGLGILECNSLVVTLTSPQPSDNLQQATAAQPDQRSTSLGEKVDELLAYLDGLHISSPLVENVREALDEPVASTAQVEPAVTTEMWAELGKMKFDVAGTSDNLKAIRARYLPDTAQATPEGADLPPLPDAFGALNYNRATDTAWRVGEFWSSSNPNTKVLVLASDAADVAVKEMHKSFIRWISPVQVMLDSWDMIAARQNFLEWNRDFGKDRNAPVEIGVEYAVFDKAMEFARAALAATTAAEPIIWIDADAAPHEDQGELIDGIHQITLLGSTQGPFGRYTTPLYRAAPPQQVDTGGLQE